MSGSRSADSPWTWAGRGTPEEELITERSEVAFVRHKQKSKDPGGGGGGGGAAGGGGGRWIQTPAPVL